MSWSRGQSGCDVIVRNYQLGATDNRASAPSQVVTAESSVMNDWVRRASGRGPEGGIGSERWRVVGEGRSSGDTIDVILQVLRLCSLRRSSTLLLVLHQEVEGCRPMLGLVLSWNYCNLTKYILYKRQFILYCASGVKMQPDLSRSIFPPR